MQARDGLGAAAKKYTKVASLIDIAENDFNLNIPLYVEKVIEDNLPSVEVALADLKTAWSESLKGKKNLNRFYVIISKSI